MATQGQWFPADADRVEPIRDRPALSDRVYEALKAMVMDQRIAPGQRINIDRLAVDLAVSQTPIREALARLEADGLATKKAQTGYSAAPLLDLGALGDLAEVRLLLEPAAAQRAAERATPQMIRELSAHLQAMKKLTVGRTYAEYQAFSAADAAFHETIAAGAGNPLLLEALTRLHSHLHINRLYIESGIASDAAAEHRRILEAVKAGSSKAAGEAMRAHLRASHDRIVAALTRATPPSAGQSPQSPSRSRGPVRKAAPRSRP